MRSRQTRMDTTGPMVEKSSYSCASVMDSWRSPQYNDVAETDETGWTTGGWAGDDMASGVLAGVL